MNITEMTAKLKAAAQEEIMCREAGDTSDLWQDEASPENVLVLTEALENYKAAYEEEARDKEVQRSVIDDALCKLLPGCQYMDPPDGGSVTPLEQVARMVEDYRQRITELEQLLKASENNEMDARCHVAELEARTLTVKLPESVIDAICHTAAEIHNLGRGVSDERAQEIINTIRCAAGIKLQIEGE